MDGLLWFGLMQMLSSSAWGLQNQYKIIPENFIMNYIDHNYLDAAFEICKINQTNAIKGNFTRKTDIPEDTKFSIKGFKWVINSYRLPVLQIEKPFKDVFEMELFDLQSFFLHQARPPITWPMEKGVTYRIPAWIPDSTKYPPNLPGGKWKIEVTEVFPNKIKTMAWSWFMDIKYNK